ncbi:MAG: hypothetical protein H3C47_08650 [Candidatus Cloacimonetes bacterium]|nr:hypothetical protein [Candidatus Cloacimonadota bacterium]
MLQATNHSNKKPYDTVPAYRPPKRNTSSADAQNQTGNHDLASLALGLGSNLNLYV